jgi:hypothetical protein
MPNYATGITQSASDHIVLILYVQHSQLLTDPLDSSGTFKDTAQFNYLNYYKSLGKTKAQW